MRAMSDYEIGRGRPPKKHQWKKGQSGNPNGRPKRRPLSTDEVEIIRRLDAEMITIGVTQMARREAELRQILAVSVGQGAKARKARKLVRTLIQKLPKRSAGGVVTKPLDFITRRGSDDEKKV